MVQHRLRRPSTRGRAPEAGAGLRGPGAAPPGVRSGTSRSRAGRTVLDEEGFGRLFAAAEEALRPILLVAFDTGMRKAEILKLRWDQVDLGARPLPLAPATSPPQLRFW